MTLLRFIAKHPQMVILAASAILGKAVMETQLITVEEISQKRNFLDRIAPLLLNVFTHSLETAFLPQLQCEASIYYFTNDKKRVRIPSLVQPSDSFH